MEDPSSLSDDAEAPFQDPLGEDSERERLRQLGKWRFSLIRGALGVGCPLFLWIVVSNLRGDIQAARSLGEPVFSHLIRSWVAIFAAAAALGCFVGFLAWRRLTSDYWPGREPDTESAQTRIGLS